MYVITSVCVSILVSSFPQDRKIAQYRETENLRPDCRAGECEIRKALPQEGRGQMSPHGEGREGGRDRGMRRTR
jgi:hypothetical protein